MHDAVAQAGIKQMRGGSRSLLMLDEANEPWVVKFRDNPQHRRILINEYLAAKLGTAIGLSLPTCGRIRVDEALSHSLQEQFWKARRGGPYAAGVHFGSRYAGGLFPGLVVGQSQTDMQQVANAAELAGIYVLDVWLNNRDVRQAVFVRNLRQKRRHVMWIDQGHCFGGKNWDFAVSVHLSHYRDLANALYPNLADDVELWIERIETIPLMQMYRLIGELPPSWRSNDESLLIELFAEILKRQRTLRRLVRAALQQTFPLQVAD